MSVLERIRSKAGIFIAAFIGFALLAFILGDMLTSGRSIFRGTQMELAKINGKSISYQEFEAKVSDLAQTYQTNSGQSSLSESAMEQVRESVWQDILREYVLKPEYDKLGLSVGQDELKDLIFGKNPHQFIVQNFQNPQTGEVNAASVANVWNNRDQNPMFNNFVVFAEKQIITDREFTKYTSLLSKGLYIPKFLAKNDFIESNEKVDFSFVVKRYTDVSDSSIKVSSSDLKAYYNDHKYLYEQTPSRDIEYVTFDIVPSKEDYNEASDEISKLKDEFATAKDGAQYITANTSDIPFDGINYKQSQLPDTLKNFAANASTGDVFGPYFENETYKLAKIVKISMIPDSVRASHILIKPAAQTQEAYSKAKTLADSLLAAAKKGANFEEMVKKYSQDPGSVIKNGDLGWFTAEKMVPQFSDTAFSMNKGEFKTTISQFGIHIIKLTDKGPAIKKFQVAYMARKVVAGSKTTQRIYAQASRFASENRDYKQFNDAISKSNGAIVKKLASSVTLNDKFVSGLESPRPLVRWAYDAKRGEVSDVITLPNTNVVAVVTAIRKDKYAPLDQVKTEVELAVRKEKKGEVLAEQLNKAKTGVSNIQDLASKLNLNVETASGISFSSISAGASGMEPRLIATAVISKPNALTAPIKGDNGVYVAMVTTKTPAQGTDYSQSNMRLNYLYQQRAAYENFEALKKLAKIDDKRGRFN